MDTPEGLTLFVDHMSQPCRSLMQLISYCKLPVKESLVSIAKGDIHKEPYKSTNPLRKIPAIKEGDWVLGESAAILCYLCARFNLTDWLPEEPKQRALVDSVLHWHHTMVRQVILNAWLLPRMQLPFDPAKAEQGKKDVRYTLKVLQRVWLAKTPFLAGDQITIADLQVCAELEQLKVLYGLDLASADLLADAPGVVAWMQRVASYLGPVHEECNKILHKVAAKSAQERQARSKL